MKLLKYLINSLYCSIFHYEMKFETISNVNIGEYFDIGKEQLYVLGKFGDFRVVIFKKYLIWK